jgi:hypothetical protein
MAAKQSSTLKKSTGEVLAPVTPATARQLVRNGSATVVTKGASGFDVIQLKTPVLDTVHVAATPAAPVKLGLDDILFKPLQYPEPTKL